MKRSIATLAVLALISTGFTTAIVADTAEVASETSEMVVDDSTKAKLHTRLRRDPVAEVRGGGASRYGSNGEGRKRLSVGVRTSLPAGTVLDVIACGMNIGTITTHPRGNGNKSAGRLVITAGAGDMVPDCLKGDVVNVSGSGLDISGSYKGRQK